MAVRKLKPNTLARHKVGPLMVTTSTPEKSLWRKKNWGRNDRVKWLSDVGGGHRDTELLTLKEISLEFFKGST